MGSQMILHVAFLRELFFAGRITANEDGIQSLSLFIHYFFAKIDLATVGNFFHSISQGLELGHEIFHLPIFLLFVVKWLLVSVLLHSLET
jgi:hypothetical protein